LAETWSAWREAWAWAGIYEAHRKAGNPNPRLATEQEIYYRGEYLERFRDLASDAYMKDGTDLDQVKKDFIKDRLSTKTTTLDTATTAMLRAVIRDMPTDEAYHPWALEQYRADCRHYVADVLDQHEQVHGKGGYSALERRVLRS
jgi:hypothetical protein